MNKVIIWDLPIRLFHWSFAGSLSAALAIGFLVDDDNPLFQLHAIFGLMAAFTLVVRLLLGLFGSRHNRFTALPLRPAEIAGHFGGVLTGKARRYLGHNPGGAVAALLMYIVVPLLLATGLGAGGETGEELHEGLAVTLLVLIGIHLAGIIWHSLRHREAVALSMLTGRKEGPESEGLSSARPLWALAILAAGAAWIGALFTSHDSTAGTVKLPLLGTVIQVGENEAGESDEAKKNETGSHAKSAKKHHAGETDDD